MKKHKSKEEEKTNKALDELIAVHGHTPEAIFGEKGLVALLTKTLVERALGAELTYHLKTGRSGTEWDGDGGRRG